MFFLPFAWTPVTSPHAALMIGFGFWTFVAHLAITQAYRIAPPPVLAPFDYTALVWAPLWGWLIWAEVPEWTTLGGAGIIVLAGLYVVYREARRGEGRKVPDWRK